MSAVRAVSVVVSMLAVVSVLIGSITSPGGAAAAGEPEFRVARVVVEGATDGEFAVGGGVLAYVSGDGTTLRTRNLSTGADVAVATAEFGEVSAISISRDGGRLAWAAVGDLWWHDVTTDQTERIEVFSSPSEPVISGDGTTIAYVRFSAADGSQVVVHDLETGTETLASVDASGRPSESVPFTVTISDDARYVVFLTSATNLAGEGLNTQVIVRDTVAMTTRRLSSPAGTRWSDQNVERGLLAAEGRWVAFHATASGLFRVAVDGLSFERIADNDVLAISADGRYVAVQDSFLGVDGEPFDPAVHDPDDIEFTTVVMVRDIETGEVSPLGEPSDVRDPFFGDGLTVYFSARAASGEGSDLSSRTLTDADFVDPDAAPAPSPTPGPSPPVDDRPSTSTDPSAPSGYWMLDVEGRVYPFGRAELLGEPWPGLSSQGRSAVKLVSTAAGDGYWILDSGGGVSVYGLASDHGDLDAVSVALPAGERPATLSVTPDGGGYWVFTDRGRAVAFGNAPDLDDLVDQGVAPFLQGPIVDSVATPTGQGFYMIGSDGGVFAVGDAAFAGSVPGVLPGTVLNRPVNGIVADPDGSGYWLVASDGGVFAFDADFVGSVPGVLGPGVALNAPVNGMVPFGDGYLMVASDGGIFSFSDEPFYGSLGGEIVPAPIVAVTAFATGAVS